MRSRGPWVVWFLCGVSTLVAPAATFAASPPSMTNYQGVLRGPADEPLSGDFDMTFRFFDAATGGNELLIDAHLASGGQAVTALGGLFSAALGGGATSDGSGPGVYLTLNDVFRNNTEVWLEVQIGAETLTPRTRILAAGYALSAATAGSADTATTAVSATSATQLGGQPATYYLNTSTDHQLKTGSVRFSTTDPNNYVLEAIAQAGSPGALSAQGTGAGCVLGLPASGAYCGGSSYGGYFYDTNDSSYLYTGYGGYGLYAGGPSYGAYAIASGTSGTGMRGDGAVYGMVANATGTAGTGLYSIGVTGAQFFQSNNPGPYLKVMYSGYGILASSQNGIHAIDYDDGGYSRIGAAPYKVIGNGAVSFAQNHPDDPDKVVVYHAPESAEVNVYTRGSAKLDHGVARVALDPTFAWTANPDLGLTAHLTPRGEPVALAVESVSSTEIVVRGPANSSVAFDYWVTGLRIGFEEMAPVQRKELDSAIPTKAAAKAIYAADPALRAYNALERNKEMARAVGRPVDPEMKAAATLRDHIGLSKPMRPSDVPGHAGGEPPVMVPEALPALPDLPIGAAGRAGALPAAASTTGVSTTAASAPSAAVIGSEPAVDRAAASAEAAGAGWRASERFATSVSIEPGDVVVLDPATPGAVRRSDREADRTVLGVALTPAQGGFVTIAVGSIAEVRADAGYGAIRAGDLLVTSPAAGTAMRAPDAEAGTILGKALTPLESGLGTVRVLVLLR